MRRKAREDGRTAQGDRGSESEQRSLRRSDGSCPRFGASLLFWTLAMAEPIDPPRRPTPDRADVTRADLERTLPALARGTSEDSAVAARPDPSARTPRPGHRLRAAPLRLHGRVRGQRPPRPLAQPPHRLGLHPARHAGDDRRRTRPLAPRRGPRWRRRLDALFAPVGRAHRHRREDMLALHTRPDADSPVRARAELGVVGRLRECRPDWCLMEVRRLSRLGRCTRALGRRGRAKASTDLGMDAFPCPPLRHRHARSTPSAIASAP
jgi:hypothetical protein